MSKSQRQYPYNFGRVFFPVQSNPNPAIPDEIRFQPLGNHVGNVKQLAKKWKNDNFSLERVVKGIDLHDVGKPQKFEILVETYKSGKFKQYIYSFKGHRFLAEYPQDIWAQTLARGHHDYSVKEITKDTYKLQKNPAYADLLAQAPLMYAKELYILEMCDQIEAELACRVIGDDEQAESRTFMDYTITKELSETNVYRIDPYPFKDEFIELRFQSWSYRLSDNDKNELQKLRKDGQDIKLGKTLDKLAKNWWLENEGKPDRNFVLSVILKPYESKDITLSGDSIFWYEALASFKPNPMQEGVFKAIVETDNPAFILKAPTGVGKFEAIVIPFLANLSKSHRDSYRLILPLPSRSLLEDQKQRCEKYLKQFSRLHQGREVSLVVDTGTQMKRYVYRDGEHIELKINPRRHLYKGDIILTTIDKFMYRYFGYGDKQKSFIFPYRINHDNTLICFDEAHSYDDISFTNFCSLLKALYEAGRALVLMTATLPETHIKIFDYIEENVIDYIDNQKNLDKLNNFQKQTLKQDYINLKQFEWINKITPESFHETFTSIVVKEWLSNSNHRIIVSVETVKDAVTIYQKLKEELGINNNDQTINLLLYHGRLPDIPKNSEFSRTKIYCRIKERDENNQPYILITTSAIEVGCDLNSTRLISQLCNPENLIQRAGRCNRKGNIQDAKVILVGNSIPEFANSLNENDLEIYKNTLQILHGQNFDAQAIMNCVSKKQKVDDYRVVELFTMLQDYVYNADLTCQSAYEKGLIITRSWTPSVTLIYDDGSHGYDLEKIAKNAPQITIPIDRLILKKDEKGNYENQYANINVYEWIYNKEETRYTLEPLKYWGWAYNKDIIVKIDRSHDGAMIDIFQPYHYIPELGFKDLPGVFIKWKSTNYEEKLQYKTIEEKLVVINYIKALTEE